MAYITRVSSMHRMKWEREPRKAGALVLSWMVNEAEKGDQVSWLQMLTAQITKGIALPGGCAHPILVGFCMV